MKEPIRVVGKTLFELNPKVGETLYYTEGVSVDIINKPVEMPLDWRNYDQAAHACWSRESSYETELQVRENYRDFLIGELTEQTEAIGNLELLMSGKPASKFDLDWQRVIWYNIHDHRIALKEKFGLNWRKAMFVNAWEKPTDAAIRVKQYWDSKNMNWSYQSVKTNRPARQVFYEPV